MAKIEDYNLVKEEIVNQLTKKEFAIDGLLGRQLAVLCVLNIYMTNDVCKGFGQDYHNKVSVISSQRRISVIVDRNSSMFQDDFPICQYEDLADDIHEILIILQAAYDRIQFV